MPGAPNMPNIRGLADLNAPTRTLTMDLTSDKKVDASSKAQCAVPEGLKLGRKVDLTIDLPEKVKDNGPGTEDKNERVKQVEFKIKAYWGCSETVPPGQPKVIDSKEMTSAAQKAFSQKGANNWKQFIDTSDRSHAYWPGAKAKPIAKDATCPGPYELTTNYCGGTAITFDTPQDFLAPIDLLSPGKKMDLAESIKVEWKPVPNAAAYLLTAFAGKEQEMVTWTSSLDPNPPMDIQSKAITKEQLDTYIKNGVLIPPDKTFCYIPKGIFSAYDSAMLSVIAIGSDKIQTKDGIETNVVVRSTATAMLGKGMGAGFEEDNPSGSSDEPTVKGDEDSNSDGDALDNANNEMDKIDETKDVGNRAKDTLKRAKDIFKRK